MIRTRTHIEPHKVEVLQGPKPRQDGYHMRDEYGMPLNDEAYGKVKSLEQQYAKQAKDYKAKATSSLQSQEAAAREKLAGVGGPNIPGFKAPEETTIWVSGDGDKPTAYRVPKASAPEILKQMTANDYYHWTQHADGTYGLALKEYGKEGYEAMNNLVREYQANVGAARKAYDIQAGAAKKAHQTQYNAAEQSINTSVSAGRAQIEDQFSYLSGLFGRDMAAEAQAWQKKATANSTAIQNLVDGGILTPKKGVIRG
jgi:hypothetical protein